MNENIENMELMRNINVFMVPHHGSISNGEIFWSYFIRGNCFPEDNHGFNDFIGIVSCRVEDRRSDVNFELIDYFPKNSINEVEQQHSVSYLFDRQFIYGKYGIAYTTNDPIFTTCDAISGFYKIKIFEDSTIQVMDGETTFFTTAKVQDQR